jgi:hypothetical protein
VIIIIPLIIVIGVLGWVLKPGKKPTTPRRIAILVTTIPALAVAVAAVIFQLLHNAGGTVEVSNISNTCFIVGLALISAYILTAVGYALAHKADTAKGLGFGACIAVIISIMELGLLEWLGGV